jgi:hypothetical protein
MERTGETEDGRDGGRVRGEGGWLRVAFAAMETPVHAREVEMPRGRQPSISSTASPSYFPTSTCRLLVLLLLVPFLLLPLLYLRHIPSRKRAPIIERLSQLESSEPSNVDVRESLTQAPGRTTKQRKRNIHLL